MTIGSKYAIHQFLEYDGCEKCDISITYWRPSETIP